MCFSSRKPKKLQTFQAVNIFLTTRMKTGGEETTVHIQEPRAQELLFMNTFLLESVKCNHHSTLTAGINQRQTRLRSM